MRIPFDIEINGRAVPVTMPLWWVPWAFVFWCHDLAPIVRHIFYAWACGKRALVE
jgi:hypothetical protein